MQFISSVTRDYLNGGSSSLLRVVVQVWIFFMFILCFWGFFCFFFCVNFVFILCYFVFYSTTLGAMLRSNILYFFLIFFYFF